MSEFRGGADNRRACARGVLDAAVAVCAVALGLTGCAPDSGGQSNGTNVPVATSDAPAAGPYVTVTVTPPAATITVPPTIGRPPRASGTTTVLSEQDLQEFEDRYGDSAAVAVAGLDGADVSGTGDNRAPYAWSTAKLLLVAQTLQDAGGPSGLSDEQRSLISRSLSASDNEAAAELHRQLAATHGGLAGAADAMDGLLRKAGDRSTIVSTVGRDTYSTYGQTLWPVSEQARFMAAIARGCVLDADSTTFLRDQMGQVVTEQRWGIGEVGSSAFKGGWGPDPDGRYLVRQVGLVPAGDGAPYAVAITARPADGTFEGGQQLAGDVAHWLQQHVDTAPTPKGC